MSKSFDERLNLIEERLTSPELLNNSGLGNELGFYIFEYPPEFELKMRKHLDRILQKLTLRYSQINLFEAMIGYLKERDILDSSISIQKAKGDERMASSLKGVLDEEKNLAPLLLEISKPEQQDIVIITGIGNTFPLLRTHRLLNCLQPLMKETPLVVFYPGEYNGQSLRLFGTLKDDNYYRAFRLVV